MIVNARPQAFLVNKSIKTSTGRLSVWYPCLWEMLGVLHSRSFVVGKLRLSPFILATLLLHFDFIHTCVREMVDEDWRWTDLGGCDNILFQTIKYFSKIDEILQWANRFIFFVEHWNACKINVDFCRQQQLISDLRYENLDVANVPKLQSCLGNYKEANFASKFLWTIANISY